MNRLNWSNDGSVAFIADIAKIQLISTLTQEELNIIDGDSRNNDSVSFTLLVNQALVVVFSGLVTIERMKFFSLSVAPLVIEYSTDTTDGYSDGTWIEFEEITDAGGMSKDWTLEAPITDIKAIRFSSTSTIRTFLNEVKFYGDYQEPLFEITDDFGVPLDGDFPITFATNATIGSNYLGTTSFYISNTDTETHSYNVEIAGIGDAESMVAAQGNFRISYDGGPEFEDSVNVNNVVGAGISGIITIHANIAASALGSAGIKNFSISIRETA